jgi:hypothetical protein
VDVYIIIAFIKAWKSFKCACLRCFSLFLFFSVDVPEDLRLAVAQLLLVVCLVACRN